MNIRISLSRENDVDPMYVSNTSLDYPSDIAANVINFIRQSLSAMPGGTLAKDISVIALTDDDDTFDEQNHEDGFENDHNLD